jgi:CzcA family heavy metal efflux pump
MKNLIGFALRHRWLIVLSSIALLVIGSQVIRTTPMDVFPEFSPVLVEVQTEGPGLSTEEIESLVTLPIEYALNGVRGMKVMRSKSVQGLSSVVAIFQEGTELMGARQLVQERLLTLTGQLPATVKTPVILSPLSSLSRVLKVGVTSPVLSQTDLTTLIRWTVRPRLMAIPGVANVAVWGQRDRQLQVLLDLKAMKDFRISLDEVIRAGQGALIPASGGYVDTPNQRLSVTHKPWVKTAEDLRAIPIAMRFGTAITLAKIAKVTEGHQVPIGDAVINDVPGLLLIVEKQVGANTLDVTKKVEEALEQLKPALGKDVSVDGTIFRPATFIEMSLKNLNKALLWGCLLVALILISFLREWRVAFISLTAIPLSLMVAALLLHYWGMTLNTMVIAGLAIALGEVVDDAIIDVENVLRRLKLNEHLPHPEPAWKVILEASLEVRSAVVYATVIVILVFLPIFFLDGISGTFFRPLATSYILAVGASLGVALVVTPTLSLLLLPKSSTTMERPEAPWVAKLKQGYAKVLLSLFRYPKRLLAGLGILFIGTALSVSQLGEEFLPHFKEYDFLMHWVAKPGTSLEAMVRTTERVSKELRQVPGVKSFGSHIGRAEVADEVVGPNFVEHWISVDPSVPYDQTVAKIQGVVDGYPGLYRDVLTYLKERIKEVISGGGGAIVVRLFGPNLEGLRKQAHDIEAVLSKVEGVSQLQVEQQVEVPQIEISVKPAAAVALGVSPGEIRKAANAVLRGMKAGEIVHDQKVIEVMFWTPAESRNSLSKIRSLMVDTVFGGKVALGEVATVQVVPTPNIIQHEATSRKIDISCNAHGRDLGAVARDIQKVLAEMRLEPGFHAELMGEYAVRQASQKKLALLSLLSLIGILAVLLVDFKSPRLALLVFASLPFALIGGVAAAFLGGGVLSLGSLVGFVTVLGIAARNGVMLISHYRHMEEVEGESFGSEMVIKGSQERLVPILMTAAATAFALLPIVAGGNIPGHEIEYPMALIIVGGLATSTLLNLFVMPVLALHYASSLNSKSEG